MIFLECYLLFACKNLEKKYTDILSEQYFKTNTNSHLHEKYKAIKQLK